MAFLILSSVFIMVASVLCNNHDLPQNRQISIEAFDCAHPLAGLTTVSLLDVTECPDPAQPVTINKTEYVQLLQDKEFKTIDIYTCRISVTRLILHCGMHSHSSMVQNGILSYIHTLGREECIHAIKSRAVRVSQHTFADLALDSENSRTTTLAGHLGQDGQCTGASYNDRTGQYHSVTVTADVKIFLRRSTAKVSLKSQQIILPRGLVCTWEDLHCVDSVEGETYWSKEDDNLCEQSDYDVLYEGPAQYMEYENPASSVRVSYVHIKHDKTVFVSKLTGDSYACHQPVRLTEHPRLMVQFKYGGKPFFFVKKSLEPSNMDLVMYMNAKLVFLEHHISQQFIELRRRMEYEVCAVERKVLKNRLAIAQTNPAVFGNIYYDKPGYTSYVAGEVIHVIKCQKVLVTARKSNRCFQELPVNYTGREVFMTAGNRMVVDYGTEIPCSITTPPMWKLGNNWWRFEPEPRYGNQPIMLEPNVVTPWEYELLQDLTASGIYDTKELEKLRSNIMFANTRRAVSQIINGKISGDDVDDQGIAGMNMLTGDYIENTMKGMWNWFQLAFWKLGIYGSAFLGIYYFYILINFLMKLIVNSWKVYQERGCSGWLLFLPFTPVVNLLAWVRDRSAQEVKRTYEEKEEMQVVTSQEATAPEETLYYRARQQLPCDSVSFSH